MSTVRAQPVLIDSKVALEKGIAQYEKGNYNQALEYFEQISEGDTNYVRAVYERVNTLLADSQYNAAKELALIGVNLQDADRRRFLLALGNAYDGMKKTDTALRIYDSLMLLFPQDNQPYYEKGISFYTRKQYDSAASYFQQSLLINPFHFRSNYMLGLSYLLQGRLSESFIAFEFSLLTTGNIELARKSISMLILICDETDEVNNYFNAKEAKYNHPLFEETDQIINVKLAMSSDYKLISSLDDKTFRETQMLMEKLSYNATDKNFAIQYYVPLLNKLYKNDMFEPYMLALFSGYHIAEVEKLKEKNWRDLSKVRKLVYDYLDTIRNTRVLNYETRKQAKEKYHYISKDNLFVVGYFKDVSNGIFAEGPVSIYEDEYLLATGSYNNYNQKDGIWKIYYPSGQLRSIKRYKDDVETGEVIEYYTNGNMERRAVYGSKGELQREDLYSYMGFLQGTHIIQADGSSKDSSYYVDERNEQTVILTDGQADGYFKSLYNNRKIQMDGWFKDGKKQGSWKQYDSNGRIQTNIYYVNNVVNGYMKCYNSKEQLEHKDIYDLDMLVGIEEYDTKGVLRRKERFPQGNGYYRITDPNGIVLFECALSHGLFNGEYTRRNTEGKVTEHGVYKYGKLQGVNK